jgi:hypothetical protein
MSDINVQSVLKEILDEERAARRTPKRGHKRLDLVEPHTLAKTSDHPHHLVISSTKSHRTPKAPATFPRKPAFNVITRFKARCKVCGGEDTWATQEVEGLDL